MAGSDQRLCHARVGEEEVQVEPSLALEAPPCARTAQHVDFETSAA